MNDQKFEVSELLNAQTGKVTWQDLARHFARGSVICVQQGEDLVAVAAALVADRKEEIDRLYTLKRLHRAMDEDAIKWQQERTEFWAVVVPLWVLVQET